MKTNILSIGRNLTDKVLIDIGPYFKTISLIAVFCSNYYLFISPMKLINITLLPKMMKIFYTLSLGILVLYFICDLIWTKNKWKELDKLQKRLIYLILIILVKTIVTLVLSAFYDNNIGSILSFEDNFKVILVLSLLAILTIYSEKINYLDELLFVFIVSLMIPTFIQLIVAPQLIGSRIIEYNNVIFDGSFWNASNITFLTSFWLIIYRKRENISRLFNIFLNFVLIIISIIGLTGGSRTIVLSFIISVGVVLYKSKYRLDFKKLNKLFLALFLIGIVIVFIIFEREIYLTFLRFKQLFQPIHFKQQARVNIWLSYLADIKNYFIFGYFNTDVISLHNNFNPHNILLNFFVRYGIIAVILFGGILQEIYTKIKESNNPILLASFCVYLLTVMINQTGFNQPAFSVQLALLVLYSKKKK